MMAAGSQLQRDSEPTPEPSVESDAEEETSQQDAETLSLDHVFEILKNERRRTVLRYLDEHEEPVSLGDLAEYVAAVENDTTVRQVTSNQRKCVYVGLYQCHLPKMDQMDIVDFNQNRGRISLGPNAPQLETYLGSDATPTRPWPAYYASLSIGAVGLLAVGVVSGGSSAVFAFVSLAVAVAVAALAAVHYVVGDERD